MRSYELTYLVSPEISREEVKTFSQKINTFLKEAGGEIIEEIEPIRKRLAYSIKKQNQAYLGIINFSLDAEKLGDFSKKIKSESQIIRFLLIIKNRPKIVKVETTKRAKPEFSKKIEGEKPKIGKSPEEKKVEIEDIEKKLAEILGEI